MKKRDRIAKKRAKATLLRWKRYHERVVNSGKMWAAVDKYMKLCKALANGDGALGFGGKRGGMNKANFFAECEQLLARTDQ